MATNGKISLRWMGHAAFLIRDARGTAIAIDPWFSNPSCPEAERKVERLDLMLITHAHSDHLGEAVALGRQFQPKVVANYEIATWLGRKGVANAIGMNTGGTIEVGGITVTLVRADHSSGFSEDGVMTYGGNPVGLVIDFGGLKLYHAGDTSVFGDMRLIGELYEPDVACLPIGGHFTMGPREAAKACELLGVKRVVPMHYGTFPILTGTPSALREATRHLGVEIIELTPGQSVEL